MTENGGAIPTTPLRSGAVTSHRHLFAGSVDMSDDPNELRREADEAGLIPCPDCGCLYSRAETGGDFDERIAVCEKCGRTVRI